MLLLVLVVYFLPKPSKSISGNAGEVNNFNAHIIGGNDAAKADGFGSIALRENKTNGYGYINDKKVKNSGFGQIEFENRLNDSTTLNRLNAMFTNSDIKVYNNSGILYALINKNQLYIENTGISEVTGFNGNINLALVVNTDGAIDSVIYLSSHETPSYIRKIIKSGYFSQYANLSTNSQHTIDAVSGATITSVATAKAVNEVYSLSETKILNDYLVGNFSNFNVLAKLNKIWIVNLILLVGVFALLVFKRFRKKKILLYVSIFTVVWLGFYLNSSFTYLLYFQPFTTTTLSAFTIVYILLTLGSSIWFKNSYCKHICPFGNAQKLVYKVSPFKKKKNLIKDRHLKMARYIITVFVIIGYLAGFEILSEYELFPYLFGLNFSSTLFAISVLMILLSMRIPNLWCRALCPTGCALDTISDISEGRLVFRKR